MRALLNNTVIAESSDTVVVEGNHYFPIDTLASSSRAESDLQTMCPWKGSASYFDLIVDGTTYPSSAWYYPAPKDAAKAITGRVAFGAPVAVVD